jgi:hypothetical protein
VICDLRLEMWDSTEEAHDIYEKIFAISNFMGDLRSKI